MNLRRKGDVEACRITVDDGLEITVGLRHEGPSTINRWGQMQQAMILAERRRLYDLRRDLPKDAAPGVHLDVEVDVGGGDKARVPAYKTAEGVEAEQVILERMVAEVIEYIRGLPWDGELDGAKPEDLAAELRRIGVIDQAAGQALTVQRLRREDPLAAGPVLPPSGGPAPESAGPDASGGDGAAAGPADAEPVPGAVGPG